MVTISPPTERLLLCASFNCTAITDVLIPFATSVSGTAAIVEFDAEADPVLKITAIVSVNACAFTVALIFAEPLVVGEVNTAEYVPLL